MEILNTSSLLKVFAMLFLAAMAFQFVFERFALMAGSIVIRMLSSGRIKCGVSRRIWKAPPKENSGLILYEENNQQYMYSNFVGLIGLTAILILLTVIFGLSMWTETQV